MDWGRAIELLGSALAGGLLAGFFSARATDAAHRHAMQLDRVRYERAQRDAKAERLREGYAIVLRAATAYEEAALELRGVMGETPAQRDERVEKMFNEAVTGLREAVVRLMLESDAQEVLDRLNAAAKSFRMYQFDMAERTRSGTIGGEQPSIKEIMKNLDDVRDAVKDIAARATAHLNAITAAEQENGPQKSEPVRWFKRRR